ncbi:hypothetical protein STEG23_010917 [Scotinomys teguina]
MTTKNMACKPSTMFVPVLMDNYYKCEFPMYLLSRRQRNFTEPDYHKFKQAMPPISVAAPSIEDDIRLRASDAFIYINLFWPQSFEISLTMLDIAVDSFKFLGALSQLGSMLMSVARVISKGPVDAHDLDCHLKLMSESCAELTPPPTGPVKDGPIEQRRAGSGGVGTGKLTTGELATSFTGEQPVAWA